MNKRVLLFINILLVFICWRMGLQYIAYNSSQFIEYRPSFAGYELLKIYSDDFSFYSWANFDGVHYITIATSGYKAADLIQAFFPLFPTLVKLLTLIKIPVLIAGFLISNFAFIALIFIWYHFFSRHYQKDIVLISLFLLLLFPTSFFFTAFYGESLFLLLVITAFYFAENKQWKLATLCAFFACLSRIVGVFLVIALLVEFLYQHKNEITPTIQSWLEFFKKNSKTLFVIPFGFSGLLIYMFYLLLVFNDPLYFYTVQSKFGAGRESSIILLPQVIWRYVKIMLTADPQALSYYSAVQEFGLSIMTCAALCLSLIKKYAIRPSWLVFGLGSFLLPTFTGTFSSMPRYVLVIFPLFLIFAQILQKKKYLLFLLSVISLSLLCINTILFIQGYWVA